MAEAVVSITLETIRDLLVGEAKFLSGVRDQVEKIQRELVRMKCLLKDADAKRHTDERVRNWVREIKDICYEIEDVLETFAVEVASRKSGKSLVEKVVKRIACLLSEGKALHKVGVEIAKIEEKIEELRTSSETYGIKDSYIGGESSRGEADENQWRLRQTYAHAAEEDFVGMQDEINQLVQLIVNHNNKADDKVIGILGMGGLGKTTLAKKIYNHAELQRCFEAFAWVCVTQKIQFKLVLQDVLKQLLGDQRKAEVKDMDEAELVRKLYQVQKEKKCMVVLDDVWEIDHWNMLSNAFPIKDQTAKSKLLLTTRKEEVAKIARFHQLRYLTEDEGWQLLRKKALVAPEDQKDAEIDPKLEVVGREIVRKCGGLPLAISVLGGILRSRSSLAEWKMVIGSHLSEETSRSIENVLALSYNDLSYNLKPCFLYMGIFKEDEEIETRKLYHLWTAEGMILSEHRREDETMMDVAERYLNELASRSMVQVQMDDLSMVRRIKSCKLHDLMRDLCLKKGKEEGFSENFDMDADGDISSSLTISAHRLAVFCRGGYGDYSDLPLEQITNRFLRTLSLRHARLQGRPRFKLCRVLVLEGCQSVGMKLPEEISKMVHLRYLSLKDCKIEKLPAFIGDLSYLETLDLRTDSEIYIPHNIFSKMKQLRHLYLWQFCCGASKKLRLNGLSRLESLVGFNGDLCWNGDLPELVGLQYFTAFLGRSSGDVWSLIINHIDSWRKIKWVKIEMADIELSQADMGKMLMCRNLRDLQLKDIHIGKLPKYESQFWPNLMSLLMRGSKLDEDSMEFLKKLPNLRELTLVLDAFIGKEISFEAGDFPQLRSLVLFNLPKLEKLRVDKGALPNLSSLKIDSCRNLRTIPEDEFRCLTNLKRLAIVDTLALLRELVLKSADIPSRLHNDTKH